MTQGPSGSRVEPAPGRRFKAVGGALLLVLIPEIAALPDAMAQAGEGTDGDGVVSQHILRIMAGSARPTSIRYYRFFLIFSKIEILLYSIPFGYIMTSTKNLNIF